MMTLKIDPNKKINKNLLNETDCDAFITKVIAKGSKLPFPSMREYLH